MQRLLSWLSRIILRLFGWTITGEDPDVPKCVVTAAPHTSQWDGLILLLAARALNANMNWMVAKDAIRGIQGPVIRRSGAIPVDREKSENLVDAMVAEFAKRDQLKLVIAPMGVTRYSDHWRSGFYRMALEADVPLVFGYLDWGRKRAGVGPIYYPTGDPKTDMDVIREFYDGMQGKFPALQSDIRLRMEDDAQ